MTLALLVALPRAPAAQTPDPASGLRLADAARMTIGAQPEIQIQEQQVEFSRGGLQAARGQFDPRIRSSMAHTRDQLPFTQSQLTQAQGLFSSTLTHLTSYRLGFEKQWRTGLLVTPSIEVFRQDLNIEKPATNRASFWLNVEQPLTRGRGIEVVTAGEAAARLDVEASSLDLHQTVSGAVARTVQAYWSYVAAVRTQEVLRATEERARTLVGEMQTLIEADQRPAADLKQVQANLANRTSQRVSAEQALFEARQRLGLAIGLPVEQIGTLPAPADDFPGLEEEFLHEPAVTAALVELALRERPDLHAVERRQAQARVLRVQARDSLRPQLNLVGGIGYAGLNEGPSFWRFFAPLDSSGFNATASVVVDWDTVNNRALGALARSDAAVRQSQLQAGELARVIAVNVSIAADAVRQNAARVRNAREASALYRAAVDDERDKLQIGLSTIIDLILTEDRLMQSLLEEVQAEFGHAVAIARLRFETGTMVDHTAGARFAPAELQRTVDHERLTTIPPPGS